jgi:hypothetical protein
VSFQLLFLRALDGSSPMLLCGPQRVPNPAHSDPQGLQSNCPQSIDANEAPRRSDFRALAEE